MTDVEIAIQASIAAGEALKGKTLTPSDVDVIRQYAALSYSLIGNQKKLLLAVLESHERLRVEKLLVALVP